MPSHQLSGQHHELVAFWSQLMTGYRLPARVYTPEEIPKKKKIEREICLEYFSNFPKIKRIDQTGSTSESMKWHISHHEQ